MTGKPIIFAVDDEGYVLQAVEMDLRRQYGGQYRIMRAESGAKALDTLKRVKLRGEPVALLLVDQRMPQMSGIEFLEQAIELYPDSKRVLLTAYADTEVAIRAINQIKIDYYLLKPWEPPEEHLYPVLQDLLDDWQAAFRPDMAGVRLIGHRWSSPTHQVRDFLARNLIPYEWLDIEASQEARRLLEACGCGREELPLVFFTDGTWLSNPDVPTIAHKIGLKTQPERPFYDLIIIGGGPAGLAAGVYGASEGLRTVLIERRAPGGQAGMSSKIENYLGFPSGLSGADLARRAVTQARRFGVEILTPQEVTEISLRDQYRIAHLADGTELTSYAILLSMGVSYRRMDVQGCDKLTGAGIYYGAATTEAPLYRGDDVYVVGGANSAGQAAMHFSRFARCTTMLVREPSLAVNMSQYLVDQIEATPSIKVLTNTTVTDVEGDSNLQSITIANTETGEKQHLPARALFIFIGATPHTEWLDGLVERDKEGFILSGPDVMRRDQPPKGWNLKRDPFLLESSVPGIFVAGDVRHRSVKRVASAVGEGSMSVMFIHQYLGSL